MWHFSNSENHLEATSEPNLLWSRETSHLNFLLPGALAQHLILPVTEVEGLEAILSSISRKLHLIEQDGCFQSLQL